VNAAATFGYKDHRIHLDLEDLEVANRKEGEDEDEEHADDGTSYRARAHATPPIA